MGEKKIVVEIGEDGSLHAETFGMIGTECADELDRLMKDIAKSVSHENKPDHFSSGAKKITNVENKRQ